jgi:hypothetical protein
MVGSVFVGLVFGIPLKLPSSHHFSKIASKLFVDAGNKVTRSVRAKIATLHTLAKRSGVLTQAELEAVGQTFALYEVRYKAYCKTHLSRAKRAASELDWQKVLDALHEIVLDTYAEAPPQRIKRADAAKKKQAAMLALRLATGLLSVLISRLEFKKNFVELTGDRSGCLQVIVSAMMTEHMSQTSAQVDYW